MAHTRIVLLFIITIILCGCEKDIPEPLLLEDGTWKEDFVIHNPDMYNVFGWETYHFNISGAQFFLKLDYVTDYSGPGCTFERTFYIDGEYLMTKDTIYFSGFYYEEDFITPDTDYCHREYLYKKKFPYSLENDTLIFKPDHPNPNGRDVIVRR